MILRGLYTAVVTPFSENGHDIAWDVFEKLIERQIAAEVAGIVILGTTGESATVTQQERHDLLKRAVAYARGKTQVLAGCGTSSTRTTLEQVVEAQNLGVDAIQLLSPSYNRPTQEGLFNHFKTIHDATNIPICLYNIPGRTAVNIETKTLLKITELERIVGIKEASGSIQQISDTIGLKTRLSVLSGDDLLFIPSAALGACGVTSVIGNLVPKTMNRLVKLALDGDFSHASELFFGFKSLIEGCFLESNPAPIKFLLQAAGYNVGPCRMPLSPLQASTQTKLLALLQNHKHLPELL